MTTKDSFLEQKISASEFKAKCLSLLDEVAETGVVWIVTKYGKPRAKLVPIEDDAAPSLLGSVSYESEAALLEPVQEDWEAER